MKPMINWKAYQQAADDKQYDMLKSAIAYELGRVAFLRDTLGKSAVLQTGHIKTLRGAANDDVHARIKHAMATKYATPSDNPVLNDPANDMAEFFHSNMPEMDMGYELLFQHVDMRGSKHDHFDIIDTSAGLVWEQREPGASVKIRKNISESKTTVGVVEYAEGLGLLDRWLQFDKFWNVNEALAEFISTYYNKKAAMHYGLLTALGAGVNQTFSTDDVKTANNAAGAILRATRDKGYNLGGNAGFYAVCEIEQVGRLEKMLTAQRGSAIVDQGTVNQPLTARIEGVIGTTHIPAGHSGWYLVLPNRKLKRADWMDLTTEQDRNIVKSATDMVGRGQYNAAIGDSDQVKRCLFA